MTAMVVFLPYIVMCAVDEGNTFLSGQFTMDIHYNITIHSKRNIYYKDCPPVTTVECQDDENKCGGVHGVVDANGCKIGEYCIPRVNGTGENGEACPGICPNSCDKTGENGAGVTNCNKGYDDNGCWLGLYCCLDSSVNHLYNI